MALPCPISAEDFVDAVFLAVATVAGFLAGGVVGLVLGLLAGYAYVELAGRVADLEATVNALVSEKEDLRGRVTELESEGGNGQNTGPNDRNIGPNGR
ncbi:hypothetical protein [Halorubrum trueperi]|uniref:Uncharacterized protein n=1 Tax=Halorubrum trueperi TaxID=2004704 RepID=A0ABD5UGZ8_9EURY